MSIEHNRLEALIASLQPRLVTRWLLAVFAVLLAGAAYQISQQLLALGAPFSLRAQRWWLVMGLYALSLAALGALGATFTSWGRRIAGGAALPRLGRPAGWVAFCVAQVLYPLLVLVWASDILADIFPRLLVYAILTLGSAGALRSAAPRLSGRAAGVVAALSLAFAYHAAAHFVVVTDFPFALSWSETSRYYYASLFFARKLYGARLPTSVLHPTRYLMQSLPFALNGVPLWGHRLWQALLWLSFTLGAAFALALRLRLGRWLPTVMTALWAYLFLFQGPVYYHLVVPLILVLVGFDSRKFWRTLGVVLLASAWAGISRVNWFPMPGALAALLYLMEKPLGDDRWDRYLFPPFVWGSAGLAAAFGAQWLYVLWSGNDPGQFASSFFSDLLWYRLWPNSIYPLGLVLNTVLVSAPLGWVLFARLRAGRWAALRVAGVLAILLIFLAGGLVVSVKIGGGSNLHNLDAYLSLLLVAGAYVFFERFVPDQLEGQPIRSAWPQALAVLAVPIVLALQSGAPLDLPSRPVAAASLDAMHRVVNHAARQGGSVLFIAQRHLLYFDPALNLPLEPEYEKVFFMEMVMARNPTYLEAFYRALESQRYAAIVSDQVADRYKDRTEPWSEEHNLWVQYVARPLLCYYQPRLTLRKVHVQVLYPRPDARECPIIEANRAELAARTP